MESWSEPAKFAAAFGWAGFAGMVAYLQLFARTKEERPTFSWAVFWGKVLVGAFVGLLTHLLLAKRMAGDYHFLLFLEAIAGWGGAETVVIFQEVFRGALKRYAEGQVPPQHKGDQADRPPPPAGTG